METIEDSEFMARKTAFMDSIKFLNGVSGILILFDILKHTVK